ncbi:hypothetical protein CAS74_001004 [Pichia kudriavzevii]|uniref:Hap4 transcription factor heteromerisation domain-containing protein n=1 Tax=Pichia kudriavzevii TaxID=4909 RepID=A0A1Z8JVK6_PICKU|nr:hypothetical protein CAS74_001004 [Pichia kudriavzevii]
MHNASGDQPSHISVNKDSADSDSKTGEDRDNLEAKIIDDKPTVNTNNIPHLNVDEGKANTAATTTNAESLNPVEPHINSTPIPSHNNHFTSKAKIGHSMPKHINTPNGTILLNTKKATKPAVPSSKTIMAKSNRLSQEHQHSQKQPTQRGNLNNQQNKEKLSQCEKPIISVDGNVKPGITNQKVDSSAPPVKQPKLQPVPIQPNPNTGMHFHPIAIKPKIAIASKPKSKSISRLNSIVPGTPSPIKHNKGSTITLTTSKNWVLPPRPKTKKTSKKKDTKLSKCGNNALQSPATLSPSSVTAHTSRSDSPLTTTDPKLGQNESKNKEKCVPKAKPLCSGCKTCSSPGIRSLHLDQVTGTVSINAQIHSNINLNTDIQKDLDVQLQQVSRENENLKKILLKLNKEINNLKLIKDKDESIKKSKLNKKETSKPGNHNQKVPPRPTSVVSMSRESTSTNDSTVALASQSKIHIPKAGLPLVENENDVFTTHLKAEAITIDPINLSYNIDSKRQKTDFSSEPVKIFGTNVDKKTHRSKMNPSSPKTSSNLKMDGDNVSRASKSAPEKKYHSCGICEIGKKCICFEKGSSSIVSTIAQVLSKGGANLLGLGNPKANPSIMTDTSGNRMGLNTLTATLKREEIVKRLKQEDKAVLSDILETHREKLDSESPEKVNIDMAISELKGQHDIQLDENICGIKFNSGNDMSKHITGGVLTQNNTQPSEDDVMLLEMIDAQLSLDPTPLVNPSLMKDSGGNKVSKSKLDSKSSQASLNNNLTIFNRNLVNLDSFGGSDLLIYDDGKSNAQDFAMDIDATEKDIDTNKYYDDNDDKKPLLFGHAMTTSESVIQTAANSAHEDIDRLLAEPMMNGDDFLMY